MPITYTQSALLRAALLRHDGLLPRPDKLAGGALLRVAAALTDAGLAAPVPVHADQPLWRDVEGTPTGLRITDAGRGAMASRPASLPDDAAIAAGGAPPAADADDTADRRDADVPPKPAVPRPHRPGSKAARLIALLSEAEGITIDALSSALAWQPHTVRAALSRLRQGGLAVVASKGEGRPATYRIGSTLDTTAPADTEAAG